MTYYMHNNGGALEILADYFTVEGGELVDPQGRHHDRRHIRNAAWRQDNNIVEVIETPYDSGTHTKQVTGYTDNGDGTWSEVATLTLRPLALLKQRRIAEVLARREGVLRGGVSTVGGKPISTESGDIDKILLMAATLNLANRTFPPSGVVFHTMEGERVTANEAQFKQAVDDMALHFYNTDNNADTHISAIEALTTQQEVIDYDITTGWPANPVIII